MKIKHHGAPEKLAKEFAPRLNHSEIATLANTLYFERQEFLQQKLRNHETLTDDETREIAQFAIGSRQIDDEPVISINDLRGFAGGVLLIGFGAWLLYYSFTLPGAAEAALYEKIIVSLFGAFPIVIGTIPLYLLYKLVKVKHLKKMKLFRSCHERRDNISC